MFEGPMVLANERRKEGQKVAMEIIGDIHEYTRLYGHKDNPKAAPYLDQRQLFDYNEHFIELGSPVRARTLNFMLMPLLAFILLCPVVAIVAILRQQDGGLSTWSADTWGGLAMMLAFLPVSWWAAWVMWHYHVRAFFLTALCARYRFNRTTRKVYVLRPRKFGGNVVLDWDRVKAHPHWCAPGMVRLKPGFQHDPAMRRARASHRGGYLMSRGLVLYWPPLDANDPERKGEDILWVGQYLSDIETWSFIRTFMEQGIDAVPVPTPDLYRRKGRSNPWRHLWEDEMDAQLRDAARKAGGGKPADFKALRAQVPQARVLMELPFLLLNTMGEWLCYWPTFPKEWNSDCGQKRRESGIGPEEPLRWTARD